MIWIDSIFWYSINDRFIRWSIKSFRMMGILFICTLIQSFYSQPIVFIKCPWFMAITHSWSHHIWLFKLCSKWDSWTFWFIFVYHFELYLPNPRFYHAFFILISLIFLIFSSLLFFLSIEFIKEIEYWACLRLRVASRMRVLNLISRNRMRRFFKMCSHDR